MPRSLYQNTVMVKGPVGAIPLAGAAVAFYLPGDGTPIGYPLYPDGTSTTPLTLPYVTGSLGELEVWADLPHRVRIVVTKGGLTQAEETIDLEYPPEVYATTDDVADSVAAHEVKADPHPVYLTAARGDLRYLPVGTPIPPAVDAYTKTQSDARYEPLDSAYTKSESDLRYLPVGYTPPPPNLSGYLPLTGGTMTGLLRSEGLSGAVAWETAPGSGGTDDAVFHIRGDGRLEWCAGDNSWETYLYRPDVNLLSLEADFQPDSNNWWELGKSARRWKKLWAAAGEFTAVPTVGGVALPTFTTADARYLQITNAFTQTLADARYVPLTLPDAKGDLLAASGPDALGRLALGTDGQVLTADSAQTLGVKWAAATGGGSGLPTTGGTMTGTITSQGSAVDSGGALKVVGSGAVLTDALIYGPTSPAWTPSATTTGSRELGIRFTSVRAQYLVAVRWYRRSTAIAPLSLRLWDTTTSATVWVLNSTPVEFVDTSTAWKEYRLPAGTQPLLVAGRQYVLSFSASSSSTQAGQSSYTPVGEAGAITVDTHVLNTTPGAYPATTSSIAFAIDGAFRTAVTAPTPASTGAVRLPNGVTGAVSWRNANDGADLALYADATDTLLFNGTPVVGGGMATDPLANAKGDVFAASADNAIGRLGVGADTFVLTADATQALGVKWAAAPGSSGGLPTTGGTMSGSILVTTTNTIDLGATAARWRKLWAVDGEFTNTPTVGGVALPTFTSADARYLQAATATTTYVPLAGGSVMTGLLGPTTTNTRDLGTTVLRWAKLWAVNAEFTNTPTVNGAALSTLFLPIGGGTLTGALTVSAGGVAVTGASTFSVAPTVGGSALQTQTAADARYLQTATAATTYVPLAGGSVLTGLLGPTTTNTRDLGTTALRWAKLWATDGEFTNVPTVGGVALPTSAGVAALYLALTGGTLTGDLNISKASAPAITMKQTADTQVRMMLTQSTLSWGPGGASAQDTNLSRFGANDLRADSSFSPTTTNARDLGTTALKWRSAYLGTVLSVAGASATADQITHAITTDAQPRLIVDGNGQMKWGPGASTAQDAFLQRTGVGALRVDNNLGVGVAPAAWGSPYVTAQVGVMALYGQPAAVGVGVRANSYYDGTNNRASITGAATDVSLANGTFNVYTAPSVAAGAIQTMTQRLGLAQTGTLTLTPDAGGGFVLGASQIVITGGAASNGQISSAGSVTMAANAGYWHPTTDNNLHLGLSSNRLIDVWAINGTIQTSHVSMKDGFAPLDPAACADAVLGTDWCEFDYRTDGPARHQRGYVLGSDDHRTSPLFGLADRQTANASSDLAVVACALQDALKRIAQLEAAR